MNRSVVIALALVTACAEPSTACTTCEADAATDANAADASAAVDAPPMHPDATSDAPDAPACSDDCRLVPADEPLSCSDRWRTCRIHDCNTFCGDVSMAPRTVGASCEFTSDCDRGMQCLRVGSSGSLTCQRFCRVSLGDGDCAGIGSTTCEVPPLVSTEDGLGVTFPSDIGLCR